MNDQEEKEIETHLYIDSVKDESRQICRKVYI